MTDENQDFPIAMKQSQLPVRASEKRVHEAWKDIVEAAKEQGIEMLSGAPSFAIGVTHDGAMIQQLKTYPDGSQRFGCPPFPLESPIEQTAREARERKVREQPEAEFRHERHVLAMKYENLRKKADRRLEQTRLRLESKKVDAELERWFLTKLPALIVPSWKK
jgi:hypothetical protein